MSKGPGNKRKHDALDDDLPRITYHSEQRTFDRLFKERSLEETKDVVRRKLGLASGCDVKLQQMRAGKFIDLEDDDDFDAFRAVAKALVAVDVQVTVRDSPGSPTRLSAAQPSQESLQEPSEKASPARKPSRKASETLVKQPRPERPDINRVVAEVIESMVPPSASKTADSSKNKRKVTFDEATISDSAKSPGETPSKPAPKKRKIQPKKQVATSATTAPAVSTETAEPAATPQPTEPTVAPEPPKKRVRKEKAKDVESPEGDEPSARKAPEKSKDSKKTVEAPSTPETKTEAPKRSRATRSVTSGSKKKADTSTTTEVQKLVRKKPTKKGDEEAVGSKQPSVSAKHNGTQSDEREVDPSSQANSQGEDLPHEPLSALTKSGKPSEEADRSKRNAGKREKIEAVAKPSADDSISTASTSASLVNQIASVICADLSRRKSNKTPQPEPSTNKTTRRRIVKKTTVSPSTLSVEVTQIPDAPATGEETQHVPAEDMHEPVVASSSKPPAQTAISTGPLCPICLQQPFHIRFYCPTVLKGPEAIRERLDELKRAKLSGQQSLIKELEGLLRRSIGHTPIVSSDSPPEAESAPPAPAGVPSALSKYLPADAAPSRQPSSLSTVPLPRTHVIPRNSYVSEVTIESRGDGSSSGSSEDESEEAVGDEEPPVVQEHGTPAEQRSLAEEDLEAVIRGPRPRRQSILQLLEKLPADNGKANASEDEEGEGELEEDEEDETVDRSRQRLSRRIAGSSDEEAEVEEEESRSPSLSPQEAATASGSATHDQDGSFEKPTEAQDGDVVMDPPTPGKQVDDSGEETQVEPEESMAVDHELPNTDKEKATVGVVADSESPPVPATPTPQRSNVPREKPQEPQDAPEQAEVEITPASHSGVPPTLDVPDGVNADPIEPADDVDPPSGTRRSNDDPIEAGTPPPANLRPMLSDAAQSTPKPGVSKRMKTRGGRIPDDETELPVLVKDLASEAKDLATSLPKKTRKKSAGLSASQELAGTRKSTRLSSVPPPSTAPAILVMHSEVNGRANKVTKATSKQVEDDMEPSQHNGTPSRAVPAAATPSLNRWETIPEISTPSASVQMDELMSSSPQADADTTILGPVLRKSQKVHFPVEADQPEENSRQEKERLFDLTTSQIPFPYSQYSSPTTPRLEEEVSTDSEDDRTVVKKAPPKTSHKSAVPYRPLSQLASHVSFLTPSLTPATASGSNGKAKKAIADDDSSSSSSSSDSDDAKKSDHIPKGRRAGSVLLPKKKGGLLGSFWA
ncbi:hypothetical protein BU15DRAFT_81425 [Melanogaster broomeanus]|nr:hypothetical protein BU15DRAFT_81425 [Melanogaster broomeanus]